MKRIRRHAAFLVLLPLLLTACLPGDGTATPEQPAGFFWGVWHGWVAPISLILGWFDKTTRVYEVVNKGWIYDLGFYMAVISGFGGLNLARTRRGSGSGRPTS